MSRSRMAPYARSYAGSSLNSHFKRKRAGVWPGKLVLACPLRSLFSVYICSPGLSGSHGRDDAASVVACLQ